MKLQQIFFCIAVSYLKNVQLSISSICNKNSSTLIVYHLFQSTKAPVCAFHNRCCNNMHGCLLYSLKANGQCYCVMQKKEQNMKLIPLENRECTYRHCALTVMDSYRLYIYPNYRSILLV